MVIFILLGYKAWNGTFMTLVTVTDKLSIVKVPQETYTRYYSN